MFIDAIKKLVKAGSLRSLKQRENLIDLSSNDYLGLSRDSSFRQAIAARWEQWSKIVSKKVGSTGSRLLTGNHIFFEKIEKKSPTFTTIPHQRFSTAATWPT